MQYYTRKSQDPIGFDTLFGLLRDGQVYSITVRETPPYGY